jgi:hypothetical protein
MIARGLLFLAAVSVGACDGDPMAETADLWPGYHRHPTATLPTAEAIARACDQAMVHFKEEVEKQPGSYVDVEEGFAGSAARKARCAWDGKAAVTALCRFELAPIYSVPEGSDPWRPAPNAEWRSTDARLVRVRGPVPWIVPKGCAAPSETG